MITGAVFIKCNISSIDMRFPDDGAIFTGSVTQEDDQMIVQGGISVIYELNRLVPVPHGHCLTSGVDLRLEITLVHVQIFFWGGWQAVSLVFKPPSFPPPQIFSVISDTSCHTQYLFFKNINCVTPPQIIFANLRRFPPKLRFPKNFDL